MDRRKSGTGVMATGACGILPRVKENFRNGLLQKRNGVRTRHSTRRTVPEAAISRACQ
jgi:hypothetical protein